MSDTVGTILQIAQLPMSAMLLVGLYLLIVKMFPAIMLHLGKQLESSNKQAEATLQMAQATTKVVEIGAGLHLVTASLMEATKGFQASVDNQGKMLAMMQSLVDQNSQQMEINSREHTKLLILARSQSDAISGLPCQTIGQRGCPDNSEGK